MYKCCCSVSSLHKRAREKCNNDARCDNQTFKSRLRIYMYNYIYIHKREQSATWNQIKLCVNAISQRAQKERKRYTLGANSVGEFSFFLHFLYVYSITNVCIYTKELLYLRSKERNPLFSHTFFSLFALIYRVCEEKKKSIRSRDHILHIFFFSLACLCD